jgi:trehalose/maltose hydrolase-like predicted phosphorylase
MHPRDRPLLGQHRHLQRGRGRYEIRGVMGPDEFHDRLPRTRRAGLDNNAYTNVMAVWVLCRALRDCSSDAAEERRRELRESSARRRGARPLGRGQPPDVRPFHGDGIISQFEGYDELEELDWEGYRERTATSSGWTASWRPRATRRTATRHPSRPTC